MQAMADVRAACAALPHSQETFPFDAATLVFEVGAKMYALMDIQSDPVTLSLKVRPEQGDELRAAHAALVPGYHLNKRHWVTLTLDGSLPPELDRALLAGSHALVARGLTRAVLAGLVGL